jgi:Raf kinase inhibitor-like YbhB/YbcL family protein
MGTFVHWLIYDMPPDSRELPERIPNEATIPGGGMHGINSLHKTGYAGPCPPSGTHHYHFKVYALDTKLNLSPGASKDKVWKAMQGHITGEGELIGLYQRQ